VDGWQGIAIIPNRLTLIQCALLHDKRTNTFYGYINFGERLTSEFLGEIRPKIALYLGKYIHRAAEAGARIVLYGHSMGGQIIADFAWSAREWLARQLHVDIIVTGAPCANDHPNPHTVYRDILAAVGPRRFVNIATARKREVVDALVFLDASTLILEADTQRNGEHLRYHDMSHEFERKATGLHELDVYISFMNIDENMFQNF
jgi:pimeloyl-ACP methyl ester carboxylesterase